MEEDGRSRVDLIDGPLPPVELDPRAADDVFATLASAGFWPAGAPRSREATAAVVKFFHVNGLGPIVIYPFSHVLAAAATAVKARPPGNAGWRTDPGDLVYLVPLGGAGSKATRQLRFGGHDSAKLVAGGGPFLLRASGAALVDDVLERLGYLEPGAGPEAADAALRVLCELNEARLSRFEGAFGEDAEASQLRKDLAAALLVQTRLQEWRVPPRDNSVRKFLKAKKMLHAVDASREAVFASMRRYLKEAAAVAAASISPPPPPRSYHEAVLRMQRCMAGAPGAGGGDGA